MSKARITNIAFGEDEYPAEVTVVMSIDIAAAVVRHFGALSPSSVETTELYHALTSRVFNAFWDDGVDGYGRA